MNPLLLIAELTHACPLRCLYCSNPLELAHREAEISTTEWKSAITQAAALGVRHISFTGGEPCLRKDLVDLVRHSVSHGLYVNLITSGVGVTEARLEELITAGVDHVQLSFQDTDAAAAREICGVNAIAKKKQIARFLARRPVAFTANLVIHRLNHARLEEMIALAVDLGAQKIEVAHVQFNGWALRNRARLLPSREMVADSMRIIARKTEELRAKVRIDYVLPDYYADAPKACMGGWAKKMFLIDPLGQVLPCHSAQTIPGFRVPSLKENTLEHIWEKSELFNAFRGTRWMQEPCRTCDKRDLDFGGCRCQALALTGDARATDPVCRKSGKRPVVDEILHSREERVEPLAYRA